MPPTIPTLDQALLLAMLAVLLHWCQDADRATLSAERGQHSTGWKAEGAVVVDRPRPAIRGPDATVHTTPRAETAGKSWWPGRNQRCRQGFWLTDRDLSQLTLYL